MSWINDFAEGSFSCFAGQTLSGFQPIEFFNFFPMWYDLWLQEISKAIDKLDLENKTHIDHLLPNPSNLRAVLIKLIPTYKRNKKSKENYKKVANFLAKTLYEIAPKDPFCKKSNPVHSNEEIKDLLGKTHWMTMNPELAREHGKLITVAGSLVHGLYNDVVTDYGWDVYGPYKTDQGTLLIRSFPELQPELWDSSDLPSVKEIVMYSLYEDVEWEILTVGCHTISKKGSPITGLKKCCITIDGKVADFEKIKKVISELSNKAEDLYRKIRKMGFEELKMMVMLQECYQLNKLFATAGMDWKPTPEMIERVKGKELMTGLFPNDKFMKTIEEYKDIFGINIFEEEVLK